MKRLFQRPDGTGMSREKLGVSGAISSILGWAVLKYLGVEVPEDVLLGIAGLILAAVQWRAREQRGKASAGPRPAQLHPDLQRKRGKG